MASQQDSWPGARVEQCGVEGSPPAWMGRFRLGWILDKHDAYGDRRMLSTEGSSVQLEPVHSDQSGHLGESRKVRQGQILKHREDFTWGPWQGLKSGAGSSESRGGPWLGSPDLQLERAPAPWDTILMRDTSVGRENNILTETDSNAQLADPIWTLLLPCERSP